MSEYVPLLCIAPVLTTTLLHSRPSRRGVTRQPFTIRQFGVGFIWLRWLGARAHPASFLKSPPVSQEAVRAHGHAPFCICICRCIPSFGSWARAPAPFPLVPAIPHADIPACHHPCKATVVLLAGRCSGWAKGRVLGPVSNSDTSVRNALKFCRSSLPLLATTFHTTTKGKDLTIALIRCPRTGFRTRLPASPLVSSP